MNMWKTFYLVPGSFANIWQSSVDPQRPVCWMRMTSPLDFWAQFHRHFMSNFYLHRSRKRKKRQSSCQTFLRFQDLPAQKLLVKRWWNWHQVLFLLQRFGKSVKRPLRYNDLKNDVTFLNEYIQHFRSEEDCYSWLHLNSWWFDFSRISDING